MSHNTFGQMFRVTTFGESHGPAIGCVVDGCPPGLALDRSDIQVSRQAPASPTSRRSAASQTVRVLSGVFADDGRQVTTGTPIG